MKVQKKPVVVEAVQILQEHLDELRELLRVVLQFNPVGELQGAHIDTPEGLMQAGLGDWIITGVAGEVYPCKKAIFAKTYRPAAKTASGMDFGEALAALKAGNKVARAGWNGQGMWAVMQAGYPDGIAINGNTAAATGLPEGTVCKFRPYLMLYTAQQDFAHWAPSGSDILSDDWMIVK